MKRAAALLMVLLVTAAAPKARGEEVIDRRGEARGAFAARPAGLFRHYCAHCHGDDARGQGRLWPMDLEPRPADLTRTTLDEEALARFLSSGSAAAGRSNLCPPWGRTLSREDLGRLARHVASLGGRAPSSPSRSENPAAPPGDPPPWPLFALILAEAGILWRLVSRGRKETSSHVPQDPPLRR